MKKIKYIICAFLCLVFFVFSASFVFAVEFTPQVSIPGGPSGTVDGNTIANYIIAIYKYAITAIGIIATIVLMIGGIRWLTAGGSPEAVNDAKAWIKASLTGLILMLCSYLLLSIINTNLVNFKPIQIAEVGVMPTICCDPNSGIVSANENSTSEKVTYTCPSGSSECSSGQECRLSSNSSNATYSCTNVVSSSQEVYKTCTGITWSTLTGNIADCKTPCPNGYDESKSFISKRIEEQNTNRRVNAGDTRATACCICK